VYDTTISGLFNGGPGNYYICGTMFYLWHVWGDMECVNYDI
jgi:hypothetical protein